MLKKMLKLYLFVYDFIYLFILELTQQEPQKEIQDSPRSVFFVFHQQHSLYLHHFVSYNFQADFSQGPETFTGPSLYAIQRWRALG